MRRSDPLSPNQISARCLAGFVIGQLLVIVIDKAIDGPGPFAMFGL
ncbi:MAG TPA: hypothetical protein VF695_06590 [Sphingomonas sp.]|jgi:hypothetical protein